MGIDLPIGACLAVISLSAWLNVALRLRYPASQRLQSHYAFLMLGYDILQLGALLYLTGGLENPFAFLLIAPVTVSASTLPPRVTVALGGLAILVATLLTEFHLPLPWFHHSDLPAAAPLRDGHLGGARLRHSVHRASIPGARRRRRGAWPKRSPRQSSCWRASRSSRRSTGLPPPRRMASARRSPPSPWCPRSCCATPSNPIRITTISCCCARRPSAAAPSSASSPAWASSPTSSSRASPSAISSRRSVSPHRLVAVPIEVEAGPAPGAKGDELAQEPVMQRNPGVIYGLGNLVENAIDFASEQGRGQGALVGGRSQDRDRRRRRGLPA